MREITTRHLTDILLSHGLRRFDEYQEKYIRPLPKGDFASYMATLIADKGTTRSAVVNNSGIEIHYGYQILSGIKKPGRDKILCLCIGAGCDLKETQRALEITGTGNLYPKRARDAAIMLAVNKGIKTAWEVNAVLSEHNLLLLA